MASPDLTEIVGTWKLDRILDESGLTPATPSAEATFVFRPSGSVRDDHGNFAFAEIGPERLRFTQAWMNDLMFRDRPPLDVQQSRFVLCKVLVDEVTWFIARDQLVFDKRGVGAVHLTKCVGEQRIG